MSATVETRTTSATWGRGRELREPPGSSTDKRKETIPTGVVKTDKETGKRLYRAMIAPPIVTTSFRCQCTRFHEDCVLSQLTLKRVQTDVLGQYPYTERVVFRTKAVLSPTSN